MDHLGQHTLPMCIGVVLAGYLIGTLPAAVPVARRFGIHDIRTVGDGNPGFWNVYTHLGFVRALPVLLVDLGKGALATALPLVVVAQPPWWAQMLGGAASMIGHAYPPGRSGHGGVGVLTCVGMFAVIAPSATAVVVTVTVVLALQAKSFTFGSRVGLALGPVGIAAAHGLLAGAASVGCLCLVTYRLVMLRRRARRTGDGASSEKGTAGPHLPPGTGTPHERR